MTTASGRAFSSITGLILFLFAAAGATLNARWLLAEGYGHYANEYARRGLNGPNALAASALTIRFSPYAVTPRVTRSVLLEQAGRHEEAVSVLSDALKYGSRDPSAWQQYVRLQVGRRDTSVGVAQALERVQQLAPKSYWFHAENAELALQYWNWGSDIQKALWTESIRYVLSVDARSFALTVIRERKEELFCRELQREIPSLKQWCAGALVARRHCSQVPLKRGVGWCKRMGLVPDALAH